MLKDCFEITDFRRSLKSSITHSYWRGGKTMWGRNMMYSLFCLCVTSHAWSKPCILKATFSLVRHPNYFSFYRTQQSGLCAFELESQGAVLMNEEKTSSGGMWKDTKPIRQTKHETMASNNHPKHVQCRARSKSSHNACTISDTINKVSAYG